MIDLSKSKEVTVVLKLLNLSVTSGTHCDAYASFIKK